MKSWIASFPRSGNTYFRNILYYVYGLESGTWHNETAYPVDPDYDKFPFVKTHLLPSQLKPADPSIPAVYLVRDGRDAIVSIAHHRSDIVNPGSDFISNMKEAIVAAEGSFFGGWSNNANAWLERATIVIKYEDLIKDPQAVFKRIEAVVEMPAADWSKLPVFNKLKSGDAMYGASSKLKDPKFDPETFSKKFFRRGEAGSYKSEMPPELQDLFWSYHGDVMERLGYQSDYDGTPQNPLLDFKAMELLGYEPGAEKSVAMNILIESTKLAGNEQDGIKRYLLSLLKGCDQISRFGTPGWNFELLIGRKFMPLTAYWKQRKVEATEMHNYEKVLMAFKGVVKSVLPGFIYERGANIYRGTDARKWLRKLQRQRSVPKEKAFYSALEVKKAGIDLLHIPLPQNSEFIRSLTHTFVVTVHDITHRLLPGFHEKHNIDLAEEGMKFIIEKDAEIISVSDSTTRDILDNYPLDSNKIHRVYESADSELFRWNINESYARHVREKYNIGPKPFLLCLSTIEPRKNLPNTIRAFNKLRVDHPELDVNLVISGSFGWKTEHLEKELHLDNPSIIFTGYVEDTDLHVIYSECLSLCYLSVYEGFGLPPLEAMSCRTTVIYGNNSSLTEVVGDAGLPADSSNVDEISKRMYELISNEDLRDTLRKKAHLRSFKFGWRKFMVDTLSVYEKVLNKKEN